MDVLLHMILPVVTLTVIQLGGTMRYVRTSMLEVINQDYIRTARAKGLPEKVVIYKHALKNAMIPIVTYVGGAIPGLFAGAMITETVFAWPGIGKYSGFDWKERLSVYDGIHNVPCSTYNAWKFTFRFIIWCG